MVGRTCDSRQVLAPAPVVKDATARRCQHGAAGPWQVVTLTDGSKRQSLLMARDDDEMFMTISLSVTPKTIEQQSLYTAINL